MTDDVQPEETESETPTAETPAATTQAAQTQTAKTQTIKTQTITRRGVAKNLIVVAIFLVFTLVIGVAFAYYGTNSIPGGNGGAAATSVSQGAVPTVTAGEGSVTVSWSATTLVTGRAVTGYVIKRYDANTLVAQSVMSACTGTITALTCVESGLTTGQWRYSVTPAFATNWLGLESAKSAVVATVEKDVTPPVNVISMSVLTGSALRNGNTIYYGGTVAGSVTVTNSVTDAGSGPASSTTAALTGTTTGWTHTPSKVSTPDGGPYVSNPFSWAAGTTSGPLEAVVGRDAKDNATTTTLTFVNDSTGPAATVSSPNGYTPGRSVPVTFTATDTGAGLASTRQLQRASVALTASGACGSTYSSFAKIGPLNPTSVYTDTQVTNGNCYKYRYLVSDVVGNQTIATTTNVTKVDYGGAVSDTGGLLSKWRLGEKEISRDTFTGATSTLLSSRSGELGASWSRWVNDTPTAVLTDAGRLRRAATGGVTYVASGVPTNADYQVSADVVVRSLVSLDSAGVVGRLNTSVTTGQGTRYLARYNVSTTSWQLIKVVNNVQTGLGSQYTQTLTAGQTYRLTLDMVGTSIRLLVDGVQRVAVTDSSITAAGRGGVRLGDGTTGTAPTNTAGLHLDNFGMAPPAVDSRGPNPGVYINQPTLGVPGALTGDSDTAATFDGTNDYVQMLNTTGLPTGAAPRSVEAWFKTTNANQQVLFNYGSSCTNQQFGLWLASGATRMVAWGCAGDFTFNLPYPVNDGQWHQVVKTYDGTAITLYLDGVSVGSQNATRNTIIDAYGFGIGAVIMPGDINSGFYFNGSLDEVSFYTSVLTPAVVSDHYGLGGSPSADLAGPTGGSVVANGLTGLYDLYAPSTTLNLSLTPGTDPSGLGDSGAQLLRATATLTSTDGIANGACGTYGSYSLVTGGADPDPSSPFSDTVADQACYSYRYVVPDSLGNTTTYLSGDIKVDRTPPGAPTLTYSALTNTYWSGAESTVIFYRSAASSGSFTVTASASDARSGIYSFAFPPGGGGFTATPGAFGVMTYSWAGTTFDPGTQYVTALNSVGLTSAATAATFTPDNTAPSVGTLSYPTSSTGTSVDVAFTTGTDSGSGVGTRLLQRASAPLTGTTCGTYGSFTTVVNGTNPTSPLANTVTTGSCYQYQYVVSDNVGNSVTTTSATVLKASYADSVKATAGLVSYWRLGEDRATQDTFTGTAGTVLSSRAADTGASWTRRTGDTITAVLSNQGRLRKSTASGGVGYYSGDVPTSPDYRVEADLYVVSLAGTAGVLGRVDPTGSGTGTYYYARYDAGSSQFQLIRNVNGNAAVLGVYTQPLTVGTAYRLALDMKGSTIRMLVNDVQRASAVDGTITAAGRAGVGFGEPGDAATPSDTAGLHLDNFATSEALKDGFGTNDGTYVNAPTLGTAGAISGETDTAATFDGVSDYGTAARQISDDLSIEFWFKSTQGIGTGGQWWEGAGLVDAEINGAANDFGVSLRSDGRVVGGIGGASGGSDVSIVSSAGGFNNGGWHHVVFTRQRSGPIRLYVDGALQASGNAQTNALTDPPNLSFGRLASGVNALAGSLDEIAVYNTDLSAATVSAHYAAR